MIISPTDQNTSKFTLPERQTLTNHIAGTGPCRALPGLSFDDAGVAWDITNPSAGPLPPLAGMLKTLDSLLVVTWHLDNVMPWWVAHKAKRPINPHTGGAASSTDPTTWGSWEDAMRASQARSLDGVGVIFSPGCGVVGIDLDKCIGEDGTLSADAARIVAMMDSYTEISPSGRGLHIFIAAELARAVSSPGLEVYATGRYFTFTGNRYPGTPLGVWPRQKELDAIIPAAARHRPIPATVASPHVASPHVARNGRYGSAALEREAASVAQAPPGSRNSTLFTAAAAVTELVNGGEISRADAESSLTAAARVAGLDDAEITRTIASAERKVAGAGRSAPPQQEGRRAPQRGGDTRQEGDGDGIRNLTDMGNAERLADGEAATLRHCEGLGWLAWDGCQWEQSDAGAVRAMKRTIRGIYSEATAETDDAKRSAIAKHAVRSEAAGRIAGALTLAQSEPDLCVDAAALDAHFDELNTPGGIGDLRTGEMSPHNPERLHTKQAGAAPGGDCPRWLAFLDRIFAGDAALIGWLQEAIGYSLTGRPSEQVLFFGHGGGANGKSVFAAVLLALAGTYGHRLSADALMLRNAPAGGANSDIAALRGKRVVICSEIGDGQRLNEPLVKDLTGGDTITARMLYREFFTFKPQATFWLFGNHKPRVTGTDLGIWRRVRLIPFTVTIPPQEQDRNLEARLLEELPGIMAWAMEGVAKWYRRGHLGTNATVTGATAEYRADSDILGAWLDAEAIIGANFAATAAALFQSYQTWATQNGERTITGTAFGRQLAERGFLKQRGSRISWRGVALRAEGE